MGKDSPSPPPPPDPYATARAQTGSNVSTAIANTVLGNANETGPLGSVSYRQNGSYKLSEPVLDANGAPTMTRRWVPDANAGATPMDPQYKVWQPGVDYGEGQRGAGGFIDSRTGQPWNDLASVGGGRWVEEAATTTRDIPQWERITTLSPEQQALYDRQTAVQKNLLDLANTQSTRLQGLLASPLSFDDIPDYTQGALQRVLADDGSAGRARVEQALFDRVNPQLDRDRAALENNLVNQGFTRGSEAFNSEMDSANRATNDARLAITAAGGQEQSLQQALAMAQLQAAGSQRERAIQERMALRNAPINEISALLGSSQVSMPQFTPFQAGTIANTPVGDYVYRSADIAQKNYQAEMQANAATKGGLFSLGGAALGGLFGMPKVQSFFGAR